MSRKSSAAAAALSPPPASERATPLPEVATRHFMCVLTGDRLFSDAHPHEIVEDGLAYRVRGSLDEGLAVLSLDTQYTLPADGELPLDVTDVVRWSGLRQQLPFRLAPSPRVAG